MTLEVEPGPTAEEVVAARRAYLQANTRYAQASARRRRMPCSLADEHLSAARTRLRAAYAVYLDALVTADLPPLGTTR